MNLFLVLWILLIILNAFLYFYVTHYVNKKKKERLNNNEKIQKEILLSAETAFEKQMKLNVEMIVENVTGMFKKDYIKSSEQKFFEKNQNVFELKLFYPEQKLDDMQARKASEIIREEFNGDIPVAVSKNEDVPDYEFYIFLAASCAEECEIFALNAVEKLYEGLKLNFVYDLKNMRE